MAKSRSKQNSKKKRDKRRLLKRQAAAVCSWQTLDVSGWFDISADPEAENIEVFFPKASGLPSRVYKDFVPGECYFNYYAHQHPDQEDELAAVSLVRQYVDAFAAEIAPEAEGMARPKKAVLRDLEKLARGGSVTASTYLGYLYSTGTGVRRNPDRAETYLRFAVSKNDPFACFWLALTLDGEEAEQFMDKSCEAGCPPAVSSRINKICAGSRSATSTELDMLTGYLAAFANNGSMRSLQEILKFLETEYGDELWTDYAPAMLRLLDGLVDEDYVPAVEYKADILSMGMLSLVRMEEVRLLYLKAIDLGSDSAPVKYASCLLHQTKGDDMTREAKEENVRIARDVLEKEYAKGDFLPVINSLLGCILAMSDDDDDFRRGIQHLEACLAENMPEMPLRAAAQILLWSDKPERHKQAIRLLNTLVRKKNPVAIFLRGRDYLEGGLTGRRDIAKGLKMLQEARQMGSGQACLLLTEILAFGLFKVKADREAAAQMAETGSRMNARCAILYSLMRLGELPGYTASSLDDESMHVLFRIILSKAETDDDYLAVAIALIHLGADTLLKDYVLDSGLSLQLRSEQELCSILEEIASGCDTNMQSCNLGPVCYTAHAMRRIGKTSNAGLAAGIFARKLHLEQGASCDDIADYLQEFVDSVPKSYVQYRLKYSNNDTDEDRPLY